MTIDLLVLDLDGTLVRLDVDWPALRKRLAEEVAGRGLRVGSTGVVALPRELRAAGEADAADACERLVRDAEVDAAATAPVNAALIEWLDSMPATPVAILSSNSHAAVATAVERTPVQDREPRIAGREDVARLKPDPEGLLALIGACGCSAERTLMVGNTPDDRACAAAAGAASVDVESIGVRWVG